MRKTVFIKNALILTATSLILRFAGIIFKVWLGAIIGSEGIGLYSLIFSVHILASTFAASGISTAVTRLVAEEISLGTKKGTIKILKKAIILTLIVAALSMVILYFGADFIATGLLSDKRGAISLKILPLTLPFMGITSCLRGYFIANRSATPNAVSQIFEQAIRIILVVTLLKKFINKGLAVCCAAVVMGDAAAEILSCLLLYLIYLKNRKKLNKLCGRQRPPYPIIKKITSIALPITSGRYLNTALRTVENILVPKNLAKYALSGSSALSQFGMIKGMALPILFFPSAILNSVSTLLIPEMSEAAAKNQNLIVKTATKRILKLTSLLSFIFAAIFFVSGDKIGMLIYKSEDIGFLIKALSPIVPLMYLDSVSDGMLKGLDQQLFSFRTAIGDSLIRILLIMIILPKFGLSGFIGIMYFSNLLTCLLNVGRLTKITKASLKTINEIFLPILSALTVTIFTDSILSMIFTQNILVYIILLSVISATLYLVFLNFFGIMKKEEILQYFHR